MTSGFRYLVDEIHSDGGRVEAVSGGNGGQLLVVHVALDDGDTLPDAVDHVVALYGDYDGVHAAEGVRVEGERAVVEICGVGLFRDGWRA